MENTENEKLALEEEKTKELVPEFLSGDGRVIFADEKDTDGKKSTGDDVMLMQCVLCVMLAVSVIVTGFINREFQGKLFSLYREMQDSPAEPFIADVLKSIEAWFGK